MTYAPPPNRRFLPPEPFESQESTHHGVDTLADGTSIERVDVRVGAQHNGCTGGQRRNEPVDRIAVGVRIDQYASIRWQPKRGRVFGGARTQVGLRLLVCDRIHARPTQRRRVGHDALAWREVVAVGTDLRREVEI